MTNKIKQIKYSRLKPEEIWFIDLINNIRIIKYDGFPDSTFWIKNGEVLFEYDIKNKNLLISFKKVYEIFEKKYGHKYKNIEFFINNIIGEYLNEIGLIQGHVSILLTGEWTNIHLQYINSI